jgi:LPXTG-motif cell wall-anchored protein
MDTSGGFQVDEDFSVFNFVFTHELGSSIDNFIYDRGYAVEVTNVTFSNAEVSSAIYAEGNLTVSNSTFENLTGSNDGPAIYSKSNLDISNSTFKNNETDQSGGAIYSAGLMFISNSTFESNESGGMGGAVYALDPDVKVINNSTFIGNSSGSAAAVLLSEGGVIANSTFWNNGDADTYSISGDSGGTAFFGNILANDAPTVVKLINPSETNEDLGANLYTDDSFDDTTSGIGSSELVTPADLKLSPLALNLTGPENFGVTKTVAIASDSVAKDFYSADSAGINPTDGGDLSLYTSGAFSTLIPDFDQRLVGRPIEAGYDVGAYEIGETPDTEPSGEPEPTDTEALADTGLETETNFLGLVGLGLAAILSGSVGLLRRRKKA